ncbi:MAG: hypothetical protein LBL39_03440 [Planctomycetaceae bacterium]|nr:hypothetical protein [Planctomycetaceae bacterium]
MNIFVISVFALVTNVFLGTWRVRYRRFTLKWWLLIHASIPLIFFLRIWLQSPTIYIPIFISFAIAGQLIGSQIYRNR